MTQADRILYPQYPHPIRFIYTAPTQTHFLCSQFCGAHWQSSALPRCCRRRLTVITAEPSCNICASYQSLIPHLLCIMQTIAYSILTCPPSTHIVWRTPQCNSVINNGCRVRVSSLTDWLKGWLSGECDTDQGLSSTVSASARSQGEAANMYEWPCGSGDTACVHKCHCICTPCMQLTCECSEQPDWTTM